MTVIQPVTRAVCRYHGGKWKLADWVISHFPRHRFYVEPFGGGGSILMKKPRSKCELYNDLDGEVVNYFKVLRSPELAAKLEAILRLTPFAREEYKEAYGAYDGDDPVEKARRFFIRLAMGWGTKMQSSTRAFRTRRGLDESTPAADFVNYPKHIKSFTDRLRGVVIENRSALDIIKLHDEPDVLFYCDPPYLKHLRANNGYGTYAHDMSDEDHIDLAEILYNVRGFVVISGYPSELYERLYTSQGWVRKVRSHRTELAYKSTECLWLSPRTAAALWRQENLFRSMGILI